MLTGLSAKSVKKSVVGNTLQGYLERETNISRMEKGSCLTQISKTYFKIPYIWSEVLCVSGIVKLIHLIKPQQIFLKSV